MGTFPRVTLPSATHPEGCVRLACVKPAASVRSEPGSNSQVEEFDLDYVTTLQLTEHLHLWVSPQRCTHQSIDQVDVSYSDCCQSPARTPPPTLLFPSQQCQRACLNWRLERTSNTPASLAGIQDLRLSPAAAPQEPRRR